ncbi:hypothetical protein GOP47_0006390 [Adiantum capillus-veneris]|uniref:Phosphate transporter PHO1 n=1 Tax=Adiantum capillus-veneris TaxID=13818 RepID=A0A9D4V2S7_ADICA|nr:hypothetical protein GOP47_0006390 [Adiantum capillus-veneris]
MVKFSKQLELQLVPEWKSAFCNYWKLKKDLKLIRLQRQKPNGNDTSVNFPVSEDPLLLHSVLINSMATHLTTLTRRHYSPTNSPAHDNIIKVHHKRCSSHGHIEIYETELLEPLCNNDYEVAFFKGVDEELNKVNGFYASKEDEFANRMEVLKRQVTSLIDLRKALEEHQAMASSSSAHGSFRLMLHKSKTSTSHARGNQILFEDVARGTMTIKSTTNLEVDQRTCHEFDEEKELGIGIQKASSPTPLLDLSSLTRLLWDVEFAFKSLHAKRAPFATSTNFCAKNPQDIVITKRKLTCAKKMLRSAFAEFYRGLGLLKSFSSLNMLAFGKILKKYDKVTRRNASLPYLKALERSRLNNSNKVDHLIDEVEKLFAQYFAKGDRKKALMLLRPQQQKSCHTTTYFVGLFSGWSISFLVAFMILLHFKGEQFKGSKLQSYAETVYPLYSTYFLIVFHMFMYGWNVYAWCRTRINYPFIFEFSPSTELRFREIFFVCSTLTMFGIASMVCHLALYLSGATFLNPNSIPFATILVCLAILVCPVNVFYRSSRFFFLRSLKRIIGAPFYKVIMADFFLADQLTSQVVALRQAQYIVCYYFKLGNILTYDSQTCGGPVYHQLTYVVSFLPYWWRLMQCLRRWVDERDHMHLVNGGKYLSAVVAVGCRITYQFNPSTTWLIVFIVSSSLATIYQMYWDIIMDWGLLQPHSKNPWLRDQLVLKNQSWYFVSMGLNCLLRFAWIQSLLHLQMGDSNHYFMDFFLAMLEVFRRGHWNFYRLENEHLNNVGKYRAVKTLPLPFRDDFVASI